MFLERNERNILRKRKLAAANIQPNFISPADLEKQGEDYLDFIKNAPLEPTDVHAKEIRNQYEKLKQSLPPRAETFLQSKKEEYLSDIKKPTVDKSSIKVYEQEGIQVFADQYVQDQNFSVGSYNYNIIRAITNKLINHLRGLLPNRKPRIIITDISKNPVVRAHSSKHTPAAGIEYGGLIYLDRNQYDDEKLWFHEVAHFIAEKAGGRAEKSIFKAYNDMLNMYYRKVRKKKLQLEPKSINDPTEMELTRRNRQKIADKLGFPFEYGLTNEHEFFAVMIENWKNLDSHPIPFKFKQIVKQILNRM
jgi:hypothetical protein